MRGSWLSGRKHRSTKPTRVKVLPGFESLAARHNNKHAGAIQLERYAGLQNQCVSSASSNLATCAKTMRVSYNGIITDFQSEDRSSILLARSKFNAPIVKRYNKGFVNLSWEFDSLWEHHAPQYARK